MAMSVAGSQGRLAGLDAAALDRGEFKEFAASDELQVYLNDLSEKVISRTGK